MLLYAEKMPSNCCFFVAGSWALSKPEIPSEFGMKKDLVSPFSVKPSRGAPTRPAREGSQDHHSRSRDSARRTSSVVLCWTTGTVCRIDQFRRRSMVWQVPGKQGGMACVTTSALTTTILGAALVASAVSAQQLLPSAGARRGDSAASASDSRLRQARRPDTAPGREPRIILIPIVGTAASRGARYLLRNGLDYINYQEYERALKYLREAETRQKELSKAERLTLNRRSSAPGAVREAVDSDSPCALTSEHGGPAVSLLPSRIHKLPPGPLWLQHRRWTHKLPQGRPWLQPRIGSLSHMCKIARGR